MTTYSLDLIASAVEACLMADFLNRSLGLQKPKGGHIKSIGCIILMFLAANFIPRPFSGSWFPILLMAVVSMIYAALFLRGSLFQKMMTVIVASTLVLVINIATLFVIGQVIGANFDEIILDRGPVHLKLLLSSKLVFFIVTRLILRFRRKDEDELSPREWIAILSMLLVTLSMGCLLFEVLWKYEHGEMLLTVFAIGTVFINIFTYVLVRQLSAAHRKKTEIALLELQISEQKSRMEDINAMYREILQIRHDMKKCVGTAAALIGQQKYDDAEQFLTDFSGDRIGTIREYAILSSDIVSAVINSKLSQCRREGIEIDVSLSDCLEGFSETDVSLLLSNLFDNAIEACRKIDGKRFLSFRMEQHMGYVRILMSNSTDGDVLEQNPTLRTTKKDKTKHGFGVKTIQEITDKHRGMYSFNCQKNEFISDIWLQSPEKVTVQA